MIKIENVTTAGWEPAIRGLRNPYSSWNKIDSKMTMCSKDGFAPKIELGENDHDLAMNLAKAGTDHSKFLRFIVVYADITAPLYWWKEFDTYRAGVEKNSCSTMHKIMEKEFTLDDFSLDHLPAQSKEDINDSIINMLNDVREAYLDFEKLYEKGCFYPEVTCKKDVWYGLIQTLPSSYNQRRTVMMSYQALANMYHARKNHKLDEWKDFCRWIETLPYSELITGGTVEKEIQ